jgi:hypothetical protein
VAVVQRHAFPVVQLALVSARMAVATVLVVLLAGELTVQVVAALVALALVFAAEATVRGAR